MVEEPDISGWTELIAWDMKENYRTANLKAGLSTNVTMEKMLELYAVKRLFYLYVCHHSHQDS
jgi:hypothetical protein